LPLGTTHLLVEGVEFSGGTVFPEARLQAEAAPFLGRPLDSADLEELRYRLTRLYVDQGYINSGAVLEGYDPTTKHLRFRLREGVLQEVRVKALGGLRPDYVADRLRLADGAPFHLPTLQERFLMLLDDPVIESLHGAILPGPAPGEAILETEATGRRSYGLSLTVDNHNPVSVGETRTLLSGTLRNLSGWGESITLGLNQSDGSHGGYLDFSVPLNVRDTRFHAFFERSNVAVQEEPAKFLDVKGKYTSYEIGLTQPLVQTLRRSVVLGLSIGRRTDKTWLLGIPFSVVPQSIG
jgi:hemolysin activation/secretion protein